MKKQLPGFRCFSPCMELTGSTALMNVQTLRCWLHLRCPVVQLSDRGVPGLVTDEGNCLPTSLEISTRRHEKWRASSSSPVSFEESSDDFPGEEDPMHMSKPLTKEELQALLTDSVRQKLVTKLSEANQLNRLLKRQMCFFWRSHFGNNLVKRTFQEIAIEKDGFFYRLHVKEDALVTFKKELAVMELELQALVSLAEEIAKSGIPQGARKVNGKYIQSHLLSRLKAIQEKLKEQIKDVEAAKSKEVPLFWCGMAESVQVMGTFDGWSQGEHLSPEYMGSYTKFSTTLMLRPGRYEIKFLVDGEWTLSPELPSVGEGLMENNLLVVK